MPEARTELINELVQATPLDWRMAEVRVDLCCTHGLSPAQTRELILYCLQAGIPIYVVLEAMQRVRDA